MFKNLKINLEKTDSFHMEFIMYNDLKSEKIILEIKNFKDVVVDVKDEADVYCEFMKAQFLTLSGTN